MAEHPMSALPPEAGASERDLADVDLSGVGPLDEDEAYLWSILSDRSGVDLFEFCYSDPEKPDGCFRVRDYQRVWFRDPAKFQVEQNARDVGKALWVGTPVLTANRGWVTMGDLVVGDTVFDETGTPCSVTRAYAPLVGRPCYKISLDDGSAIVADQDHQWETVSATHGRAVLTTEQISQSLRVGHNPNRRTGGTYMQYQRPNHRIECPSPLDYGEGSYDDGYGLTPTEALPLSWEARLGALHGVMDRGGRVHGSFVDVECRDKAFSDLLYSLGVKHERSADVYTWTPAGQLDPFGVRSGEVPVADRVPSWAIVDVQKVKSVDVRCIEVDSSNRLFLAGRELIPTHNSLSIMLRAGAWPFRFAGQDMLITAPRGVHLRPLTEKIEHLFFNSGIRLFNEMLLRSPSSMKPVGLTKQPAWSLRFANGANIVTRLPNLDGSGVKGQHVVAIELDEAQDYPSAGFTEIMETMKSGVEGAQWRVHGVASGRRDMFYRMCMNELSRMRFKVHRYPAMYRDTWSEEERNGKIDFYGGSDQGLDYRRNVYGHHGDASSKLFVLSRLMRCVRKGESAWAYEYNRDVYKRLVITDELVEDLYRSSGNSPMALHDYVLGEIPRAHFSDQYLAYTAGADLGFVHDPTEVLVFGLTYDAEGNDMYRLLLRVRMLRVSTEDQAMVIKTLFEAYGDRLRSIGMDRNGVGLGLVQTLGSPRSAASVPAEVRDRIKGYAASQSLPVAFQDRMTQDNETPRDLVIKQNINSWGFDRLRNLVDSQMLELPNDPELLAEFQGQTVVASTDPESGSIIRRGGSKVSLHTLDAAILWVAAKELPAIQEQLEEHQEDVVDFFGV